MNEIRRAIEDVRSAAECLYRVACGDHETPADTDGCVETAWVGIVEAITSLERRYLGACLEVEMESVTKETVAANIKQQVEAGLIDADAGVVGHLRELSTPEAVDYCLDRGWGLSVCSDDGSRFNYGINHVDNLAIVEELGSRKPEILAYLESIGHVGQRMHRSVG